MFFLVYWYQGFRHRERPHGWLPVLLEADMDGTDYERLMALCGEMDLGAEPEPETQAEEPHEVR